jgi:TonB family protein
MPPIAPAVKVVAADPAVLAIHRGDVLMATDKTSAASRWYNADSPEARGARAIVTRYSRMKAEATAALMKAAQDLVDNGLVQYHFGAIETENAKELQAQIPALERAVKLMPQFGRAYAELARVYALGGKAGQSIALVDRALELEPEFADRFYAIRAESYFALRDFDSAFQAIRIAESLPHADRETLEAYTVKVNTLRRRIETARRDVDSRREEQIRREFEKKVNEREPVKPPVPVAPVPSGTINYEIATSSVIEVVEPVYPDYPEDLRKKARAGRVALRLEVLPDGKVKTATVTSSQVPELNAATVEAAKKWTFKLPPRARPAPVVITLTFTYALQ